MRRPIFGQVITYVIIGSLVIVGLLTITIAKASSNNLFNESLLLNIGTELLGVAISFVLVELIWSRIRSQQQQREAQERILEEREKRALILQMGSPDRAFAIEAARLLKAEGWLMDGSLREANLRSANLQNSFLGTADLVDSKLTNASLAGADLRHANLQTADLLRANLQEANLENANLQGAGLGKAELQGANLKGANLREVMGLGYLDENTTLPDGSNWTPDIDIARFTDPDHPEFWRPDDPESPAFDLPPGDLRCRETTEFLGEKRTVRCMLPKDHADYHKYANWQTGSVKEWIDVKAQR